MCSFLEVLKPLKTYMSLVLVAEGPYEGVVKLQTMHCLFEAYEHVLSLLERVFTPMFCHSDEVSPSTALTLYYTIVCVLNCTLCKHTMTESTIYKSKFQYTKAS